MLPVRHRRLPSNRREREDSSHADSQLPTASLALCYFGTLEVVRPVFRPKVEYVSSQRHCRAPYKTPTFTPLATGLIFEFGVGLAATLAELESEKDIIASDPEKLKILFHEMTQMCLWCAHNLVIQQDN